MVLLDPTGQAQDTEYQLAPRRLRTLDGARLGLLGNSKLNADEVLVAIGDLLAERYRLKDVLHEEKPSFSRPAPDDMIERFVSSCDVVIAGVGD